MSTTSGILEGWVAVAFSFEADLPGLTCTFHTLTEVTGDIATYTNGGNTLTLTNQPLEGGACGPAYSSGKFTITSSKGTVALDT